MAQVKDAFGKEVIKKTKIIPKLPPIIEKEDPLINPAVNPNTGEKLGTFEEGKAQWEQLRADTKGEVDSRTNPLKDALVAQQETIETPTQEIKQTTVKGPSISDQLTQQSTAQTNSLVAQLKQRIAESVASQQSIINKAPQQFDPYRAESEVAKSQQLRSALERSSVLGDRGGIGRSEALATQTSGEQRLTDINLAQENMIADANAEIARLENEGRYEEARIKEDQTNMLLQSLMNEQVRQEGIAREDTIRQENLALDATEQKKQDFINTINRFAQDYTAEIERNQNDGDTSNDWQIALLESAKQDKIQAQGLDPNTGLPLPVDNSEAIYDRALEKWKNNLPLTQEEMATLNVSTSTKPVVSGGYADEGLSETSIRYKITNGIPLNAEEANAWGVEPGYVAPDGGGVDDTITADLSEYIQSKGGDTRQAVIEYLINNDGMYSVEQGYQILDDYGLTPADLQRVVNVPPSVGQ